MPEKLTEARPASAVQLCLKRAGRERRYIDSRLAVAGLGKAVMSVTSAPSADAPVEATPSGGAETEPVAQEQPSGELARLLHLAVPLSVRLAERDLTIESILKLNVGSVLEFDCRADSELELVVADQPIGAGQAVKIGENFGLRITRIGTPGQRIRAMGR
jgi:flagellar motor switch/type III secretory pathway protein FliN